MKKSYLVALILIIAAIIVGVVYWMMSPGSSYAPAYSPAASNVAPSSPVATPPVASSAPAPAPTQTLVLNTMTSPTLGTYLVATNGMTLYTYAQDKPGVNTCTGQCAPLWPPYTVAASQSLSVGINIKGALSTLKSGQLAYKGMPLYFWVNDAKPGDTTGQNIAGFVVAKP